MYLPKHIHKIVFTLVVIHSIRCEALLPKKYPERSFLIAKLLNIVNSSDASPKIGLKNGPQKIILDQNTNLKNIFTKKILVKRLVPHGYRSSKYEYDQKFKALYKPLLRIHAGKPEVIFRGKEIYNINNKSPNKPVKRFKSDIYEDEELLQPFQVGPRKVTFRSILEDVMTYASKVETSGRRKLKYAILEILENPKLYLRHKFATGSEERKFAESIIKYEENQGRTENPKKKKWLPDYSFWNYWTYDKTIHQDVCKGKLIQWGNVCIETPVH